MLPSEFGALMAMTEEMQQHTANRAIKNNEKSKDIDNSSNSVNGILKTYSQPLFQVPKSNAL